jgi:hypothetical protein
MRERGVALVLGAACALVPAFAPAQVVIGGDVQKRANGVIALMGYTLTNDVTTSALSISNAATGNPDFRMTTLGGGFTVRKDSPLYLEGTLGYATYDPTFVTSDGVTQGSLAAKWDAYSVTGGIGWNFPIASNLVLRPIFNLAYGRVDSHLSGSGQTAAGEEFSFLTNGKLEVYGAGGSLVLDFERYRPENEVDVELRYTYIPLKSLPGSSTAVAGSADAQSLSLWSRWRAPTGMAMLERPLRYVLEFAYTGFLGDLDGVLGFNHLTSLGTGLELDTGAYGIVVTRARLMVRYQVGEHVRGWSLGLGINF